MKLFNILFLAIKEREYDFLKYRHEIDSKWYDAFSKNISVTHLKLYEPGFVPKQNTNELFFKGRNGFFHLPLSLYLFIKRQKPGVIFIHGFGFPFQLLVLRFFIPATTKVIVQHHAEKPFVNSIKRWFQKMAYSKAHGYLFASKELAQAYLDLGIIKDKNSIHEVMEGSSVFEKKDKQQARAHLQLTEAPVFLWVGRLDANKDPLTVLKAFATYKENGHAGKLYMIYGANDLEDEVVLFIKAHGLLNAVHLKGKIEHTELEAWYSAADYFIAASHYEGSGIALCEAMSCGCIPIVTKIPSFIQMVGTSGFLFETGNADELYTILCALTLQDLETRSANVTTQFQNELSFEAMARKTEAVISALL